MSYDRLVLPSEKIHFSLWMKMNEQGSIVSKFSVEEHLFLKNLVLLEAKIDTEIYLTNVEEKR